MTKYVKLEDVLGYVNAAGLEACDLGNQEVEDAIAGIMLGMRKLDVTEIEDTGEE